MNPATPQGRPSSHEPLVGPRLRAVSERTSPSWTQQPPALCEASARRAEGPRFVSRQQAQPQSSVSHRPASQDSTPATSLKWLIFCFPEGNKPLGVHTPWLPGPCRQGASSHISLDLPTAKPYKCTSRHSPLPRWFLSRGQGLSYYECTYSSCSLKEQGDRTRAAMLSQGCHRMRVQEVWTAQQLLQTPGGV